MTAGRSIHQARQKVAEMPDGEKPSGGHHHHKVDFAHFPASFPFHREIGSNADIEKYFKRKLSTNHRIEAKFE
jgi:hypothetical protein